MSDGGEPTALRILHYVPAIRLDQGGVVRAILDWCDVLSGRGHAMTLVAYDGRDVPADWTAGGPGRPHAHVLPRPRPPAKQLDRASVRRVDALLRDVDVLHLHAPWLDGNRQLANLARQRGLPYVVTLHGMLDDWAMNQSRAKKGWYMRLFGRRLLDGAARVHCTAEAELAQAGKWFANPATVVLPYLVDLRPYADLPGPAAGRARLPASFGGRPLVLFLSRLSEQKGVDVLIAAAGIMRDAGVDFVLAVAGTGSPAYEAGLRAQVTALGLGDRIAFLGQVNGTEKVSLYQAADVFVLPTRHENFGLVLAEAMACGTAVVATRGTDVWAEVERGGAVIADNTPAAIAAAAGRLLADPADRQDRGRRGRAWAFTYLAVDPLCRQYEGVYREVIGR